MAINKRNLLNKIYDYVETSSKSVTVQDIIKLIIAEPDTTTSDNDRIKELYDNCLKKYVETNDVKYLDRAMVLSDLLDIDKHQILIDIDDLITLKIC